MANGAKRLFFKRGVRTNSFYFPNDIVDLFELGHIYWQWAGNGQVSSMYGSATFSQGGKYAQVVDVRQMYQSCERGRTERNMDLWICHLCKAGRSSRSIWRLRQLNISDLKLQLRLHFVYVNIICKLSEISIVCLRWDLVGSCTWKSERQITIKNRFR